MFFREQGGSFVPTSNESMKVHRALPAGVYMLKTAPRIGWFFESLNDFEDPGRIYGDLPQMRDRIMGTFERRSASTGVALSGDAGSGKTLLARMLGRACVDKGIPVIVVASPHSEDSFKQLIQDIDQPCMILFDEFEKTYDRDGQQALLTLLDGVFNTRKMFVFTCNDQWKVDEHMHNRPGRIYYWFDFNGLGEEAIRGYCEDNLDDKEMIDAIVFTSLMFQSFSFDMLQAIVEEMNAHGEQPSQVLEFLNVKIRNRWNHPKYSMTVEVDGGKVARQSSRELDDSPLAMKEVNVGFHVEYTDEDGDEDKDYSSMCLNARHLSSVNKETGEIVYRIAKGDIDADGSAARFSITVTFKKLEPKPYNPFAVADRELAV